MQKKLLLLSLFASSLLVAESEVKALKEQLNQQNITIDSLHSRLDTLELQVSKRATNMTSFSQSAYLPDIAFVLNMSAVSRDVSNTEYQNFSVPGYINSGDGGLIFNQNRGFNLNYSEVSMHSDVGPYFEAYVVFHLQSEVFETEEAYVKTTSLPYSMSIKAGKFKSAFGRVNAQHHHSWKFDEQPIVLEYFFGPDSVKDAGIQFQWVAPTDTYIMLGFEALQGTNPRSFGDTESNTLYTGYFKSSIDVGDDISILGGVSYFDGKNSTLNQTKIYGLDLTIREQLGSYSAIVWQSEYLQRDYTQTNLVSKKQDGFYTELLYQYDNNYATGLRYEAVTQAAYDNLDRYTVMLEYKPFEMTRLRLSYSYDRSKLINTQRKDINTIMFTLNIEAGAHGAHAY